MLHRSKNISPSLFSPATYNEMLERLQSVEALLKVGRGSQRPIDMTVSWINAVNKTGEALQGCEIVQLEEPAVLPNVNEKQFKNHLTQCVVKPKDCRKIAVAFKAAPSEKFTCVTVNGLARVRIRIAEEHLGDAWNCEANVIVDDMSAIQSSTSGGGINVLWVESQDADGKPAAAGEQWAIVRVGNTAACFDLCEELAKFSGYDPAVKQYVGHAIHDEEEDPECQWFNVTDGSLGDVCDELHDFAGYSLAKRQFVSHNQNGDCEWYTWDLCEELQQLKDHDPSRRNILVSSGPDCCWSDVCSELMLIDGYDENKKQFLCHTIATSGTSGVPADCEWVDLNFNLCEELKQFPFYAPPLRQFVSHDASGNCVWYTFDICSELKTIDGFDATKKQVLVHKPEIEDDPATPEDETTPAECCWEDEGETGVSCEAIKAEFGASDSGTWALMIVDGECVAVEVITC